MNCMNCGHFYRGLQMCKYLVGEQNVTDWDIQEEIESYRNKPVCTFEVPRDKLNRNIHRGIYKYDY